MHKDQACPVIHRMQRNYGQDDVSRLTDEWKLYQWQEIPEDWTSLDIKGMDPTSTEDLITTGKECSRRKTQQTSTLLCPAKACDGCTLPSPWQ